MCDNDKARRHHFHDTNAEVLIPHLSKGSEHGGLSELQEAATVVETIRCCRTRHETYSVDPNACFLEPFLQNGERLIHNELHRFDEVSPSRFGLEEVKARHVVVAAAATNKHELTEATWIQATKGFHRLQLQQVVLLGTELSNRNDHLLPWRVNRASFDQISNATRREQDLDPVPPCGVSPQRLHMAVSPRRVDLVWKAR